MKTEELRIKVEKAKEAVAKTEKTIERHKQQATKKLAIVVKNGWDPEDRYCRQGTPDHQEAYWAICEYQDKLDDIKNAEEKLEDKKRILQGWEDKLIAEEKREILFLNEVPEEFKQLEAYLVKEWDAYDIKHRENMKAKYAELGYKEFIKEYTHRAYEAIHDSNEKIHKENTRTARELILGLYARVIGITGKVTSWEDMTLRGGALNGFVTGENGTCKVESILAGGWNIQRLHVRVLTHKVR